MLAARGILKFQHFDKSFGQVTFIKKILEK